MIYIEKLAIKNLEFVLTLIFLLLFFIKQNKTSANSWTYRHQPDSGAAPGRFVPPGKVSDVLSYREFLIPNGLRLFIEKNMEMKCNRAQVSNDITQLSCFSALIYI
jgi:hypothetical protein